jgi:long-chain acyl-CoA synthetase
MDRPWLEQYPEGSCEHADTDAFPSVVALMLDACERFAEQKAFSSFGASLTYREVDRLSRDFAAYLQSDLGIVKGDRVAIMLPNILAFPVATLGILRAGAVQVNINPLYTSRELKHQLIDANAKTILIYSGATGALAEIVADTSIEHVVTAMLGDLTGAEMASPSVDGRLVGAVAFVDSLQTGAGLTLDAPAINAEDLAFLQYTGGTTGLSKGAMLTHRNLIANIMQYKAFSGVLLGRPDEVVITALPLYHIFALMVNMLTYFHLGGVNVLITNPRDMPAFIEEWSKWTVTTITAVNTLFNGLLHTPGFAELDFSQLSMSLGGGMAVQDAVSKRWKEVTGRHICQGYGLSETSPVLTLNPIGRDAFTGSIGLPFPDTDIVVRDEAGRDMPAGEVGELCSRGPQVMQGYWRQPEATAEVMTDDGFFRTGDIATMDKDGYFYIVDRKKDMILVSGFNVFPNEVEAEVAAMSGVLECACVGVPDDKTGEAVRLFVVKKDSALTEEAVQEYCRTVLTGYKVPRDVVFIDEVPKSAVGKLLRRELRDLSV